METFKPGYGPSHLPQCFWCKKDATNILGWEFDQERFTCYDCKKIPFDQRFELYSCLASASILRESQPTLIGTIT